MPNEGFLQRWSRLKTEPQKAELPPVPVQADPGPAAAAPGAAPAEEAVLPTLADAAELTAQSDFAPFVGRKVDTAVRRLAMKKLFADPHFNLIDGLDIYMGDYNLPDPVSPAMLAALTHSRSIFGRVEEAIDTLLADTEAAPPAVVQAEPMITEPPAVLPAVPPNDQEAA